MALQSDGKRGSDGLHKADAPLLAGDSSSSLFCTSKRRAVAFWVYALTCGAGFLVLGAGVAILIVAAIGKKSDDGGSAALPPFVEAALHEYNDAVRRSGADEAAAVRSWLPAHTAAVIADDTTTNFTVFSEAVREIAPIKGFEDLTWAVSSTVVRSSVRFELPNNDDDDDTNNISSSSSSVAEKPFTLIFVFNPLVVSNFDRLIPSPTSSFVGPVTCKGGEEDEEKEDGCTVSAMQRECEDAYDTNHVAYVPNEEGKGGGLCPRNANDCGTCRVTTFLSEVCAVVARAKGPNPSPPFVPANADDAEGEVRFSSCFYPFDNADVKSHRYAIRRRGEDVSDSAAIQRNGGTIGASGSSTVAMNVTLRLASDPFITLQRVTKGTGVFLSEDGTPYERTSDRRGGGGGDVVSTQLGVILTVVGGIFFAIGASGLLILRCLFPKPKSYEASA